MTELVFVDTNVLVYARDARDEAKQRRAYEWLAYLWERRAGRLSAQVLYEFYVTVTRKLRPGMGPDDATLLVGRPRPSWPCGARRTA